MSLHFTSKKIFQSVWQCQRIIQTHFIRQCSSQTGGEEFKLSYLDGDQKGIAVFAFNRPHAKNAMGRNIMEKFGEAVNAVKFDPNVRVVILRSEVPGAFCVGADLKERIKMKPEEVGPFITRGKGMLSDFSNLPMPTIAALDGIAVGGGLELALCADLRVAANSTRMGLVETRLAIIPGGGGTQRLPRLVGIAKAKELIYTARIIDGQEAMKIGLVNDSMDQNEAGDAAYQRSLELAHEINANGPVGVKMAKNSINKGIEVDLETGLRIEEMCYAQVIPTKDRMEALQAFKEKRPAKFEGK